MYSGLLLFLALSSGALAESSKWEYNNVGVDKYGRECMSSCKNERCIIDWFGKVVDCALDVQPAPRFHTAMVRNKQNEYCLSNCGFFGWEYEWCVTTDNADWDYCNSGDTHRSVYKNNCKDTCEKHDEVYYWCYLEMGSWQYCAPPREDTISMK